MACNHDTQILISRYTNEETTPAEKARASAHLEGCAACSDLVERWRGQRQLFVWANALTLPELTTDTLVGKTMETIHSAVTTPVPKRRTWSIPRVAWSRGYAFAAACAVTAVAVVWYTKERPLTTPWLASGVTTFHNAETVRVYDGATLEVAPNTRLTRLGENKVRLDAGWLRARVRHGGGLRIVTSRLDVRDIGTVFQMNAGPAQDNVFVEEGEVSATGGGKPYVVGEDQILLASANGKVEVARFPKYDPAEDEPGTPLINDMTPFTPAGCNSLDWDEGVRRLSARFPDSRTGGSSGQSINWPLPHGDQAVRFSHALAKGARKGLRAHISEIAEAQAGATSNIGDWSFPVAYVMVDDVVDPAGLPADAYRVELEANRTGLFWRFRGSLGTDVSTPVRFEDKTSVGTGYSGESYSSSSGRVYDSLTERTAGVHTATLKLADWPGKLKPTIRLELRPVPRPDAIGRTMLDESIRQTAAVTNLDLQNERPSVLYLDRQRGSRVLIAHNRYAGRQMGLLLRDGKAVRAGSALMGVVMTDVAWAQPRLPAGVYLLWWIVNRPGAAPRWAVSRPNTNRLVYLTPEAVDTTDAEGQANDDWRLWPDPSKEGKSNANVSVVRRIWCERTDGFPFEFQADPVSASGSLTEYPRGALGRGRFLLRKP